MATGAARLKTIVIMCASGVFLGLVAATGVVALTSPSLVFDAGPFVEDTLIGQHNSFVLPVKNPHVMRDLVLTSVAPSCGCTSVVSFEHTITAGSVANIEFKVVPGAYDDFRDVKVTLIQGDGTRRAVILHIAPVCPFAGWPQQAVATVDGSDLVVEIDPWYRDIITIQAAYADGKEVPAHFDRDTGLVRVSKGNNSLAGIELVMLVGEDEPQRWAGNISIHRDLVPEP